MSFGLKLQLEHYTGGGREIKRKCVYMQTKNIKICIVIVIIYTKYVQLKITQKDWLWKWHATVVMLVLTVNSLKMLINLGTGKPFKFCLKTGNYSCCEKLIFLIYELMVMCAKLL